MNMIVVVHVCKCGHHVLSFPSPFSSNPVDDKRLSNRYHIILRILLRV